MAGSSLLALIDDITTVLDDVALLTKVAAKKTAGVVGDDLAVNANQVTGVDPARELPVVWAVAKGSLLNKAILISQDECRDSSDFGCGLNPMKKCRWAPSFTFPDPAEKCFMIQSRIGVGLSVLGTSQAVELGDYTQALPPLDAVK